MYDYFKKYHAWEVLRPGESIVVSLPIQDLLCVQQRMTTHERTFRLDSIDEGFGEMKTRVTRVL